MTNRGKPVRHIVVIGAARSGTKLIRDTLADATNVGRVPYDVPFVWRVGRLDGDDLFSPQAITSKQSRFIRNYIDSYARGGEPTVIEKTVGNTLRVPVVNKVLPDAHYVHILRDGTDVIESTMRQWRGDADRSHLSKKIRHVPLRVLPTYAMQFARDNAQGVIGGGTSRNWGVRYPGMREDLSKEGLATVCAKQWVWSVRQAAADLAPLGNKVITVKYEDFVRDPDTELSRIASGLELELHTSRTSRLLENIRTDRQGTGATRLTPEEMACIVEVARPTLDSFGYSIPPGAGLSGEKNRD